MNEARVTATSGRASGKTEYMVRCAAMALRNGLSVLWVGRDGTQTLLKMPEPRNVTPEQLAIEDRRTG